MGTHAADGESLPPHSRVLWGLEGEDLEVLLSQDGCPSACEPRPELEPDKDCSLSADTEAERDG